MWSCILGERNSGKSVYVENLLQESGAETLYIATLPRLEMYEEIIERHRRRRPDTWECIELFEMSVEEIETFPYEKFGNIMLDNLSYFVLYKLFFGSKEELQKYKNGLSRLIRQAALSEETKAYFVDTPIEMDMLEPDEKEMISQLFTDILESAKLMEWFWNGEVETLTLEEAKRIFLTIHEEETYAKYIRDETFEYFACGG